jgi:NADPH:quinone reductase-like Zn-dependent oxidoreductase
VRAGLGQTSVQVISVVAGSREQAVSDPEQPACSLCLPCAAATSAILASPLTRHVPKDDEVLVKIHATTVNRTDCQWRKAEPFISRFFSGLRRPKRKILGSELAGEVEAVGAAVSEFEVGDHVFGSSAWKFGAHAEFICMRESAALVHKPA